MRQLIFILIFSLMSVSVAAQKKGSAKKEVVSLDIIDVDSSVKNVKFIWPLPPGPPPVGGTEEVMKKVDAILKENNVTCPPKRQRVSDNVWLCGNGKKIRTSSAKLISLFSEVWNGTE